MKELEGINRTELAEKLARELPEIREELSLPVEKLEEMTGIGAKRIIAIEEGRQEMRWKEYLSFVFVFWSNDASREILDRRELFPLQLRKAFSVNRNAHEGTLM